MGRRLPQAAAALLSAVLPWGVWRIDLRCNHSISAGVERLSTADLKTVPALQGVERPVSGRHPRRAAIGKAQHPAGV